MDERQRRSRGAVPARIKRERMRRRRARARRRLLTAVLALILFMAALVGIAVSLFKGRENIPDTDFEGAAVLNEQEQQAEPDENAVTVVVDAGHGGKDQGTASGSYIEKDINLAIAKKLADRLELNGIRAILTRDEDVKVGLEGRANIANDAGAALFISVHCNYCEEDAGVNGLECYYREESADGKALAEAIIEAVGDDRLLNRGTRTADFKVLRFAQMPAVLVETGFLSNQDERQNLADSDYQGMLAQRLADGILAYLPPEEEDSAETGQNQE